MLEVPSRPRLGEILVAAYAVIGALGSVGSFWNGEYGFKHNANYVDPFEPYSSFFGIRLINASALVIDALIAVIVIASLIRRNWSPLRQRLLVALCAVAAALTWFELWYGSTLRYENRDK